MGNSDKQNAKQIDIVSELFELRKIETKLLTKALRDVVFMARTSGGVAGPDKGLMEACDKAEDLLLRLFNEKPNYFIGTENGIEDIDWPIEQDPCDLAHDYQAMQYGSDAPSEYDPS